MSKFTQNYQRNIARTTSSLTQKIGVQNRSGGTLFFHVVLSQSHDKVTIHWREHNSARYLRTNQRRPAFHQLHYEKKAPLKEGSVEGVIRKEEEERARRVVCSFGITYETLT
ncbi:hypothetical protein CDAR_486401 [Caerostris darwini]|uniref:Uncharacterized protein n=1 Tax=Caerostris darwini TaxID=1538125 RepID=A0AAV4M9W9_9ARAC|nr:hypothetical protein CDAR_486401 [Caerostris darwini]